MRFKGAHIAVRIENATLTELRVVAKKKDRPVSYLIRKAVEEYLKMERKNASKD
jgi:predicted transcriptional regulator